MTQRQTPVNQSDNNSMFPFYHLCLTWRREKIVTLDLISQLHQRVKLFLQTGFMAKVTRVMKVGVRKKNKPSKELTSANVQDPRVEPGLPFSVTQ